MYELLCQRHTSAAPAVTMACKMPLKARAAAVRGAAAAPPEMQLRQDQASGESRQAGRQAPNGIGKVRQWHSAHLGCPPESSFSQRSKPGRGRQLTRSQPGRGLRRADWPHCSSAASAGGGGASRPTVETPPRPMEEGSIRPMMVVTRTCGSQSSTMQGTSPCWAQMSSQHRMRREEEAGSCRRRCRRRRWLVRQRRLDSCGHSRCEIRAVQRSWRA